MRNAMPSCFRESTRGCQPSTNNAITAYATWHMPTWGQRLLAALLAPCISSRQGRDVLCAQIARGGA